MLAIRMEILFLSRCVRVINYMLGRLNVLFPTNGYKRAIAANLGIVCASKRNVGIEHLVQSSAQLFLECVANLVKICETAIASS